MKQQLKGIYAAMVTPYGKDGTVDLAMTRRLASYLLEGGVDGIMTCGSTGEFPILEPDERRAVAEAVLSQTAGKAHLLVNVSSMSRRETADHIRHARELGADGILVVTPYYYLFDEESLFRYFVWISEQAAEMPVYLYNIPSNTKNAISPMLFGRLTQCCQNICGIKDSSMDFMTYTDYQRAVGPEYTILTGNDAQILAVLQANGAGAVVATASIFPTLVKGIYEDYMAGKLESAREKQEKIYSFRNLCRNIMPVMAHKRALEMLGFSMGPSRIPFRSLTEIETRKLGEGMVSLGLLQSDQLTFFLRYI